VAKKSPGGSIQDGQAEPFFSRGDGHQKIVGLGLQEIVFENHARSHDADDFPPHEPLGLGSFLHLLADGHFESPVHQLLDIPRGRVVRNPAEGDGVFLVLVPGG
jgi:hypothetical protein